MAAEVRLKIHELYHHQDPEVKRAADVALQEFQRTDLAWKVSSELLDDANSSVQFFGAQTLYSKVQRVAQGYDETSDADLNALAIVLCSQYVGSDALTQQSKQRVALCLAVLAVHLCLTVWTSAVSDLIALASSHPQVAWSCLLAIPEHIGSLVHTYTKTDRRTMAVLGFSDALISASLAYSPNHADDSMTGTVSDSAFSLSMQCLKEWSKVLGMKLVTNESFAHRLEELIPSPAGSSEVLIELLLEVLGSSPGAFMLYDGSQDTVAPALGRLIVAVSKSMENMLPRLQGFASLPTMSLEEDDARRVARWARVAGVLVESYTQVLWMDRGIADIIVAFISACIVVHPHVANSVSELWAVLKDTNRDGKLPPGVLSNLLQQLSPACITSFVRFGRLDACCADDRSDLLQLRDAQQDILVDMYCIAGDATEDTQRIFSLLFEHLQRADASADVHGEEIVWFAFNAIAEVLADEPSLPGVYVAVLQSVFSADVNAEEHCATAATLLRSCGPHFENNLQPQLPAAVQWLMAKASVIPLVASEAVQELCGYAGQHLLPHVAEFLSVVSNTAPLTLAEVDAALHGALVGIVRNLQIDSAVDAFMRICEGTSLALKSGIDVAQVSGRELLHRVTCRLLRCTLVMEQGGGMSGTGMQDRQAGEPSLAARTAGTCLTTFLVHHWQFIAPPCKNLLCAAAVPRGAHRGKPMFEYSDESLQVNVLALCRYAARAANDSAVGGPQLCCHVVQFSTECCSQGQLAVLSALGVIAESREHARVSIFPAIDFICHAARSQAEAGRSPEELVPFLEMVAALVKVASDDLMMSAQLPVMRELCVDAIRSNDQNVLRPSLFFLQKLIFSRSLPAETLGAHDIIRVALGHFQRWPRSVGSCVFKLFSAFAERHEEAFIQVATAASLPCVADLSVTERAIVAAAFRSLRGPRLKAFLVDVGAVARGESGADVLLVYDAGSGAEDTALNRTEHLQS
eukprot:TRINITY_DN33800_c0_g1_i1.p1 TRINITY_DN33800_c0_g1~~TRINITY_DN33800_c0_g1_i1.p1  ORF type:complete len:998 (-),score=118.55 TRINITY_DN33800_c0_g1_i1:453-3377(-)